MILSILILLGPSAFFLEQIFEEAVNLKEVWKPWAMFWIMIKMSWLQVRYEDCDSYEVVLLEKFGFFFR